MLETCTTWHPLLPMECSTSCPVCGAVAGGDLLPANDESQPDTLPR
jgi:hypothetical protein